MPRTASPEPGSPAYGSCARAAIKSPSIGIHKCVQYQLMTSYLTVSIMMKSDHALPLRIETHLEVDLYKKSDHRRQQVELSSFSRPLRFG